MMVKCYGYNSVKHGMDFAQDLKMGQYMKVPPRVLFFGQVYASILATATQTGGKLLSLPKVGHFCLGIASRIC